MIDRRTPSSSSVRDFKEMALTSWWRLDMCAEDKFGSDSADAAANVGRLRPLDGITDTRGSSSSTRHLWHPTLMDPHGCSVSYDGRP